MLREKYVIQAAHNMRIHELKKCISSSVEHIWSVWNDCTHMYKSLVFGDEFLAQSLHLKSYQRCSRPVKFFHTDWIIIYLWSLSYTQRHCHVTIEKGSAQTDALTLEAQIP